MTDVFTLFESDKYCFIYLCTKIHQSFGDCYAFENTVDFLKGREIFQSPTNPKR